jgi:hypothetical protein
VIHFCPSLHDGIPRHPPDDLWMLIQPSEQKKTACTNAGGFYR